EASWRGYNRSLALGSAEPYQHKISLPEAVMTSIKPAFRALAAPELLRKCLHGRTQNANEFLNNLIWCRCPKTTFVGACTVKAAVYDAVSFYNNGNQASKQVLEAQGVIPGVFCNVALNRMDNARMVKTQEWLLDLCSEQAKKEDQGKCQERFREEI
ncbi:hypothetical protein HPB47_022641, partial [Ixodes persulcatus]